jgi:hypothetical protein
MARPRSFLQEVLADIVPDVYFQPPTNTQIEYPCIVYRLDDHRADYANNGKYNSSKRYQVTVIDRNPDSELPDQVFELPLCEFDRFFTADGLNHWVYNLFF